MWLVIVKLLGTFFSWLDRESIKKDGRNEANVEALQEVNKRWEKANEIENEPIADDDVSFLLRPEDRTADNLRLLQTGYPAIFNNRPDASNEIIEGVKNSNRGLGGSGEYRPAESGIKMDIGKTTESKRLRASTDKTQQEVRQVMPIRRLTEIYFSDKELACKSTGKVKLNDVFDRELLLLRVQFNRSMKVNSCCRSKAHNEAIEGHPKSLHVYDFPFHPTSGSCAIDVARKGREYDEALAKKAWERGFSIGVSNTFLHLDTRTKSLGMPQIMYKYKTITNEELVRFKELVNVN